MEAYKEALAEGSSGVLRVPIMIIGQYRSGKTSLRKSLRGQKFDPKEVSTDGIEKDPSHFSLSKEIWNIGQKDQEPETDFALDCISREVASRLRNKEQQESNQTSYQSKYPESDVQTKDGGLNRSTATVVGTDSIQQIHKQLPTSGETKNENIVEQKLPNDLEAGIEKHLKKPDGKDSEEVYSVIWDFAGQAVFYATHPVFLTSQAIYLLAYNLHLNPDEKASPTVHQMLYKPKEDRDCIKTNADYLDVWMSSVSCLASLKATVQVPDEKLPEAPEKLPEKLPPVFLVCTNADRPYDCSVAPDHIARGIYGSLKDKPHGKHLFEEFFVVDNSKSGSEDECPEVKRLKNAIHAVAQQLPHVKQDIPIKWLNFERALQSRKEEGHRCISLDEARTIARECQIDDDKQTHLLNFLHDQRTVIHFSDSEELKNLVVLDTDWMIDVFKRVITVKPYDAKSRKDEELWRKLQETGILEDSLLRIVWDDLSGNETVESLIEMMMKFCLLLPWPSSESGKVEYLVPSMLMSHRGEKAAELLANAYIPSLFLRFKQLSVQDVLKEVYVPVPLGFFPQLVLKFLQWCTEKQSKPSVLSYPKLYKDFANIFVYPDEGYSVILLQRFSVIELVVLKEEEEEEGRKKRMTTSDVKVCVSVRRKLEEMLTSLQQDLCWLKNVECELNILCPVCSEGGSFRNCDDHPDCKKEGCLHFWSESKISECDRPICSRDPFTSRKRVPVETLKPWFGISDKQVERQTDRIFL